MRRFTDNAEYYMENTGESFTFYVREEGDFCAVRIDHITEYGAKLFFDLMVEFDVHACQLTAVAEDRALERVTEICRGLL